MTSCLLSVALLLNPTPITAPKEAPPWQPTVISAPLSPTTSSWLFPPPELYQSLFVETPAPALIVSLQPSPMVSLPPPPPPPTDRELVDEIFGWPGAQLVTCESHWDRFAVGKAGERGLFQVHPVHRYGIVSRLGYSWDQMFEVEPNIRVAVEIRRVQGLRAWTCWKG